MTTAVKLLPILGLLLICALAFTSCETMNGAGKDIEKAGTAVQDAAQQP